MLLFQIRLRKGQTDELQSTTMKVKTRFLLDPFEHLSKSTDIWHCTHFQVSKGASEELKGTDSSQSSSKKVHFWWLLGNGELAKSRWLSTFKMNDPKSKIKIQWMIQNHAFRFWGVQTLDVINVSPSAPWFRLWLQKTVEGYLTSRAGAERSMLAVFLLCQNQLQVQTLPNLVFHWQ